MPGTVQIPPANCPAVKPRRGSAQAHLLQKPRRRSSARKQNRHRSPLPQFDPPKPPQRDCLLQSALQRLYCEAAPDEAKPPAEAPLTYALERQPEVAGPDDHIVRERRAYPRRKSVGVASICRSAATNTQQNAWRMHASRLTGQLVDISMNGAAILFPQPIDNEERLQLRLTNPVFDKTVHTSASVVRSVSSGMGQWKIVCKFDKGLTFEQVNDLGKYLFRSEIV